MRIKRMEFSNAHESHDWVITRYQILSLLANFIIKFQSMRNVDVLHFAVPQNINLNSDALDKNCEMRSAKC